MSQREELTAEFCAAVERLTVPVRMGEGIDDIALDKVKKTLVAVAGAWRGESVLPKAIVAVLLELSPVMEASSHAYPDERGDRIRDIAEELRELAYDVVSP